MTGVPKSSGTETSAVEQPFAQTDPTPHWGHQLGGTQTPPGDDSAGGRTPPHHSRRVVALVSLSTLVAAALTGTLLFQKLDARVEGSWVAVTEHLYVAILDLNDALEAGDLALAEASGHVDEAILNDLTTALDRARELDITHTYKLDTLIPPTPKQERIDAALALTTLARSHTASVTAETLLVMEALDASTLAQATTNQQGAARVRSVDVASALEVQTRNAQLDLGRQEVCGQSLDDLQHHRGVHVVVDPEAVPSADRVVTDHDPQGLEEIQGLANRCLAYSGQVVQGAAHHRSVLLEVVEHRSAQRRGDGFQQGLLSRGQHCWNSAGFGHAPTVAALLVRSGTLTPNMVLALVCAYIYADSSSWTGSARDQPGGAKA